MIRPLSNSLNCEKCLLARLPGMFRLPKSSYNRRVIVTFMNLRICAGLHSTLFLTVAPPRHTEGGVSLHSRGCTEGLLKWAASRDQSSRPPNDVLRTTLFFERYLRTIATMPTFKLTRQVGNPDFACVLSGEKLTVWCALWAGIIGILSSKNDEGHNVTVNGDRYRAMITNFFILELNNHDVQELWFQQDCATCHTARATIDLLKDTFGDRLISRFGPVNWPPRSCDLTPLDYFLWGYVKSLVYADKPQTLDHLEDNKIMNTATNVGKSHRKWTF
ncbi:uncharacterized protein TNCV_2410561 [Trichonephila clavipes]|nr:uncharacterized protein TNCV_2410561 [Trichonephila clavipes]